MCSIVRCRWGSNPTSPPTGRRPGVVEWQPCVAFDLGVPLGMQAPGAVVVMQAGVVYDSSRPEALVAEARARLPGPGQVVSTSPNPRLPAPRAQVHYRHDHECFCPAPRTRAGGWNRSNPSRVAPADPTRARGEVRRDGMDRTALEGHAVAYSSRQGRPGYG